MLPVLIVLCVFCSRITRCSRADRLIYLTMLLSGLAARLLPRPISTSRPVCLILPVQNEGRPLMRERIWVVIPILLFLPF